MRIQGRKLRRLATLSGGLVVALSAGCATRSSPPSELQPERVPERHAATGAVSSLTEEEIREVRATRLEEMLRGRVAGLEVDPRPDGSYSLRIRGPNSLLGDSEPLLVVNGVPLVPGRGLWGINPNDVERIDVLKSLGATARYGSRGANGVILITTRSAR